MKGCCDINTTTMFKDESYTKIFEGKKQYEGKAGDEEVSKVLEYTKTEEYKEKNFSREALVINPLKACQPLGAIYAAIGFENCIPYIHGSQGCAAYFRSHFTRHFKEPFPTVSDSMTEDSAVFGGHGNMYEGLKNANTLYKPEIIAVATSCMAEVIGDDLNSFVKNAKEQGDIPKELPVVCAHTPSFIGSHVTGYDNMMYSFIREFGVEGTKAHDSINVILGFDTYVGNYEEIKRIFKLFDVTCTIISDPSSMMDSPTDGCYKMYRGGTSLEDLKKAPGAKGTIFLQKFSTTKTLEHVKNQWGQNVKVINPLGITGSDELIMAISELTGKDVPAELTEERGKLVDAVADSYYYIYGKKFAINGDPDVAYGLARFILELGGEPTHVLITNGSKKWVKEMEALFKKFPQAENCKIYFNKDMWHLRSLLFTEPVDYIIGNSYAKFLWRDCGIPLIRIGFPIFDRHHLHRYSILGYKGGINMLNWIVNTILEEMDRATINGPNFDVVR